MDTHLLKALANQLNLTAPDEEEKEEYVLTDKEECAAIEHEIITLKKHIAWKMSNRGASEGDIAAKLSLTDWEKEVNEEEILKRANSNKLHGIWQKEQRLKEIAAEKERQIEVEKRCTAKYMFNGISWVSENVYFEKLIVDEDTIPLIKAVCFFLSKDKRFETELGLETESGYSLNKGLLIRGISGLGKSYIIYCAKDNELQPISIHSMIDIAQVVKDEGEYLITEPGKIIYLDDVGTEPEVVNHYGTKINWFKNFMELYYQYKKPFNKLIISTNNSFTELENKYGFRVRSRIKDMFNIIDVKGEDKRGKQKKICH